MTNTIYTIRNNNPEVDKYLAIGSCLAYTNKLEAARMYKNKKEVRSFITKNFSWDIKKDLCIIDIYTGEIVHEFGVNYKKESLKYVI